jgi:hypothetical protein
MEKIIELMKGIGASDELANAICEELRVYSETLKSKYEQEYQGKVERAKKVCVTEVNEEKIRLAKRVKTFLESKAASFEAAATRQRAIEESESAVRLKKAKAVLEGVELKESGATSQQLQDSSKKIARLEKMCATLKEERNTAVSKANVANDIAAKTLQRNRQLEEKVVTIGEGYCQEHKLPFPNSGKCAKCGGAPKVDDKAADKKDEKVAESKKPEPARLDESRKAAAGAASTRRTMTESQTRSFSSAVQPVAEVQKIADTLE